MPTLPISSCFYLKHPFFFFSDGSFIWSNHGFVINLSLNHDFQTIFPSPNFRYIPDWWEVMLSDVKLPSGQLHGSISFVMAGLLLIFLTRLIIYVNVSLYLFLSIYLSIYLSILLSISAYCSLLFLLLLLLLPRFNLNQI